MNPPWSQRVKPQGAPSTSLRQEQAKKSAAESHKKTAAAAAAESSKKEQSVTKLIPVLKTTQPLDVQAVSLAVKEHKDEERRVAFSEQTAAGFTLVAPALTEIFTSLKLERRAVAMRADRSPSATAEKFVLDSKPVTKCRELQEAEEEVAKCQSAQLLFDEKHPCYATVTEELEKAKATVCRLSEDMPSPDLKASCLDEILAAYRRSMSTRKDRAAKGREAAEARREKRAEIVRTLRAELDSFEDALLELEDSLQTQYDDLGAELDEFDEQVLALIEEKVDTEGAGTNMDRPVDPALDAQRRQKEFAEEKVRKL